MVLLTSSDTTLRIAVVMVSESVLIVNTYIHTYIPSGAARSAGDPGLTPVNPRLTGGGGRLMPLPEYLR